MKIRNFVLIPSQFSTINIFNSISEAANAVGVSSSKISNAAKNKKISGKYAWAYIDDDWFKDKELLNKIFKNG